MKIYKEKKKENSNKKLQISRAAIGIFGLIDCMSILLLMIKPGQNKRGKSCMKNILVLSMTSKQIVDRKEKDYGLEYFYGNKFNDNTSMGYISINDCSYKKVGLVVSTRFKSGRKLWDYGPKRLVQLWITVKSMRKSMYYAKKCATTMRNSMSIYHAILTSSIIESRISEENISRIILPCENTLTEALLSRKCAEKAIITSHIHALGLTTKLNKKLHKHNFGYIPDEITVLNESALNFMIGENGWERSKIRIVRPDRYSYLYKERQERLKNRNIRKTRSNIIKHIVLYQSYMEIETKEGLALSNYLCKINPSIESISIKKHPNVASIGFTNKDLSVKLEKHNDKDIEKEDDTIAYLAPISSSICVELLVRNKPNEVYLYANDKHHYPDTMEQFVGRKVVLISIESEQLYEESRKLQIDQLSQGKDRINKDLKKALNIKAINQ